MSYKLAVFDMDGTILNTLDDLMDSTNHILSRFGYPERTFEEIRSFVGNGLRKLMERSLPTGTPEQRIDEVLCAFNEYYKDHCAIKTRPYEGINEVIACIRSRGIVTAVVSNKAQYGVDALCREFFDGLFDFAVGDSEGIRRKPFPDGVLSIIERAGFIQADTVYIGDSEVDFQTAQNAGVDVIMVEWGFRGRVFIEDLGAHQIAESPKDLLTYFDLPNFE